MDDVNRRRRYKHIIGVPVIPGLPNSPITVEVSTDETDQSSQEGEHSPELRVRSRENSTSSNSIRPISRLPWKLGHTDFLPNQIKGKNEETFETFKVLVERANDWLKSHSFTRLFTCETILWMTIDKTVYTDNGILTKSMNADKKTKFYRGLRIWYYTTDDTFYDSKNSNSSATIYHTDYMPEGKTETIKTILSRINSDLSKKPLSGRIMKIETLRLLNEMDSSECYWKEEPQKDKSCIFFLRVYFVNRADLKPEKAPEIGLHDFWPEYNQRTPHNQGYETYSDVWKQVARWIHSNVGLKMINIQSVFIKFKKDSTSLSEDLTHRCNFTEHGSAFSSLHQAKTEYMQITRVVYLRYPEKTVKQDSDRIKLAYKTFAPSRIVKESNSGEEEFNEGGYEDIGQLEERMNTWLQKIGNHQLIGMETIPVRLLTGGQEVLASDATFIYNCREKNVNKEPWRVNIRMYLTGRVQDLPASPRHRPSRTSFTSVT